MFEPKQVVIYQPRNKCRELEIKEQEAIFDRVNNEGNAVIYVKYCGEFKKRKEVSFKYLRAK